jgi:hypothetical protein
MGMVQRGAKRKGKGHDRKSRLGRSYFHSFHAHVPEHIPCALCHWMWHIDSCQRCRWWKSVRIEVHTESSKDDTTIYDRTSVLGFGRLRVAD